MENTTNKVPVVIVEPVKHRNSIRGWDTNKEYR